MKTCLKCGAQFADDATFCSNCGFKDVQFCPECGKERIPGSLPFSGGGLLFLFGIPGRIGGGVVVAATLLDRRGYAFLERIASSCSEASVSALLIWWV